MRSKFWLGVLGAGVSTGLWTTVACAVEHKLGLAIFSWLLVLVNAYFFVQEWNLPKRGDNA